MSETNGGIPIEENPVVEINAPIDAESTIELHAQVEMGGTASEYNAEAWAVGERGGVPVSSTDQTYHNNSKYYAQQMQDHFIDDTAGLGDTGKVWSADKLVGEFAGKADIIEVTDSTQEAVKTLADGADGMPMAVTVGIDPVQDLHGQSSPYPAGGGKNLLENQASSLTKKGITCTVNSDGTMELNGTCTSATAFIIGAVELESTKEYIMSGCPTGGAMDTYYLWIYKSGTSENYMDTGNGVTINPQSDGQYEVEITALIGASFDHAIFKPMVRLSSVADDTYAPYSNICPVSGWTGATITKIGKNLIPDGTNTANGYELDKYLIIDGTTATAANNYISEYFPVEANGTYTMHSKTKTLNNACVCFYDENKNYIAGSAVNYQKKVKTITAPATAVWARATQGYNNADFAQFEKGSVPTEIVPYSCNEYQIDFPDGAGTVYGGTLTVNKDGTGTLVVDEVMVLVNALTWTYQSQYTRFLTQLSGIERKALPRTTHLMSSVFTSIHDGRALSDVPNNGIYAAGTSDNVYVKSTDYDNETSFVAAYGTQQIVYKLAEPQTYQLTASDVGDILTTVKGINNIFADTGDILSVGYSADTKLYVDQKNEAEETDITAIHTMIADSDATTATESHASGDVFICNNQLVRATDVIATGETVVIGSNAEVINLADYIKEQVTDIAVLRTDVDALKALPISMNDILLKKLGFSDFVSESSDYGRVELHGNVLTAKATPSGSTYYHINLLGTHRVKSGTWGNYNPLPEDFVPTNDYFMSNLISVKNRKLCLRTVGEVQRGSGNLRLIVMKDNGDDTYTYKYTPLTMTYGNIALLDGEPLDIREWDGISLVFTSQARPADIKMIFSVEEGDGGTYTLENK